MNASDALDPGRNMLLGHGEAPEAFSLATYQTSLPFD
jgi:hypothetical protein